MKMRRFALGSLSEKHGTVSKRWKGERRFLIVDEMRRFTVGFVNMKPSLFPSRKTAVPEMRRSLSDSSEHEEAERPTHPLRTGYEMHLMVRICLPPRPNPVKVLTEQIVITNYDQRFCRVTNPKSRD